MVIRSHSPRVSVIVVSRDEGAELRRTVQNLEDTLPGNAEIVIVDDGSTDGSAAPFARRRGRVKLVSAGAAAPVGVARARNLGVTHTQGGVVIFADAHIRLSKLWHQPLLDLLDNPQVGAAAGAVTHLQRVKAKGYGLELTGPDLDVRWLPRCAATPFPAPILPGCCLAMRRAAFDAAGGWDGGLLHRGGVDNEMCLRLWLFGFELMLAPQVVVRHLFRSQSPYPVGWPQYLHNRLRLAFSHLSPTRLGKVVRALHRHKEFGEALALLLEGDISARRREMMARRVRSDDWYFERFGLKW